jgi:hypothetical protein
VTLDPLQELNSAGFGTSDVLHVAFTLWGIQDSLPPFNTQDWTILYVEDEKLEPKVQIPAVRATKSVLFPGVSLLSMSVDMPAGYVVDGAAVTSNGQALYQLGSLAPLQTATTRQLRIGAASFSGEAIAYGLLNGDGALSGEIATANSSLSFIPMLTWLGLLLLGGVLWLYVRHRRSIKESRRSRDAFVLHQENNGANVEEEDLLPEAVVSTQLANDIPPAQIQSEAVETPLEVAVPPLAAMPLQNVPVAIATPSEPVSSSPSDLAVEKHVEQPVVATRPTMARPAPATMRFRRQSLPPSRLRPTHAIDTKPNASVDDAPPLIQG